VSGEPVLYLIPGSHACRAATLMLEHKGMSWRERVLVPGVQTMTMRLRGFPGRTVPAIKVDGERVQTNRRIARFLDGLRPEPRLVPADREAEVVEAERFVDGLLQPLARRLVLSAGRRDLAELADHADSGRLGTLLAPRRWRRRTVIWGAHRYFGIHGRIESLDLAALPAVLDNADRLVAAGSLNGPELNAADFQAAPCLALIGYRLDVRDLVESRPSWALVERLLPKSREALG
jgi:glutathione S-transferase